MSATLERLDKQIDNLKRRELRNLLSQCTKGQQIFFARMYKSVEEISEDRISWAIQQCKGTIAKNKIREVIQNGERTD